MSGYESLERRLARLELIHAAPTTCPTCHDHPFRVVYVDENTDEVLEESMPASGCPTCGQPIDHELVIVLDADEHGVAEEFNTR